jgi:hypothetical protein
VSRSNTYVRLEASKLADDLEHRVVGPLCRRTGMHKGLGLVVVGVMVRQLGSEALAEVGWVVGALDGPADGAVWRLSGYRLVERGMREVATDARVRSAARLVAHAGQSAARRVLAVTRWGRR